MAETLRGATAELPMPELGATFGGTEVTPQQADIEATQASAGEFRKGIRSGLNLTGATIAALAGALGDATSNEEFAAARMQDAHELVNFAGAVGPRVRSHKDVKDFTDVVDFASGMLGQGISFMAPTAAAGLVGSRFGLRGAALAAGVPSVSMETGEQVLRTEQSPGTLAEKLPAAAAKGVAAGALDVVVPALGATKLMRAARGGLAAEGGVAGVGKAAGKNLLGEAATEAAQEKLGQIAHTAVEPGRDTSEDTTEMIDAALMGGLTGGLFGGGVHALSQVAGAVSPDQARAALSRKRKPLDPDALPEIQPGASGEEIGAALDGQDAQIEVNLQDEMEANPRKWANYEGWEKDPEIRDQFAAAVREDYVQGVERPRAQKLAGKFRSFMEETAPEEGQKSKVRTALDMQIFSDVWDNAPEEIQALPPEERAAVADDLKSYVLHHWGKREEIPASQRASETAATAESLKLGGGDAALAQGRRGRPETRRVPVPDALVDMFGASLPQILTQVYNSLKSGGLPMRKAPNFKKALADTGKRVREARTGLDQVIIANLNPKYYGKETSAVVVAEVKSQIIDALDNGLTKGLESQRGARWRAFNDAMIELFGVEGADRVMDAFEQHMATRTSKWGDAFIEEQDAAEQANQVDDEGKLVPKSVQDSPYQDKRLQVPHKEGPELDQMIKTLRSEYSPKQVRFRPIAELDSEGNMTGRQYIVAEDAQDATSFGENEIEQIKESHGKSGLKNGVITIVRQDPENPKRNRQDKISIPKLVALNKRTFKHEGEGSYDQAVVLDALSRFFSRQKNEKGEGDFTLSEKSQAEAFDFPPNMPVTYKDGKLVTWGQLFGERKESPPLYMEHEGKRVKVVDPVFQARRYADNLVERAQQADTLEEAQKASEMLDARVAQYQKIIEDPASKEERSTARSAQNVLINTRERLEREYERRAERDEPLGAIFVPDDKKAAEGLSEEPEGPRDYQEETGLPLTRPAAKEGSGGALETGIKKSAKAPGEVKTLPPRNVRVEQKPDQVKIAREQNAKYKRSLKGLFSRMKTGYNEITEADKKEVRDLIQHLLGDKAEVVFQAMDASGEFKKVDGVEKFLFSIHMVDPLSVAAHEAMHAFSRRLRMLDPSARNILSAAASQPTVQARLRILLKDEPAALRQLSDADERIAYMFQFWSAGVLQVGPKTKTFFQKVTTMAQNIWHSFTGIGDNPAQLMDAEKILLAFYDGRLRERATLGRTMAELLPHRDFENKIGDFISRTFDTADAYVRDMNVPAFTAAANQFYNPEGSGGFVQTKHVFRNKFMNQYNAATQGVDKAALLQELRAGAPTTEAGKEVRRLLDNLFTYMKDSGVKVVFWNTVEKEYQERGLRHVKNYTPRVYDFEKLHARFEEFVQILVNNGVPDARLIATRLLQQDHSEPNETDFTAGITPFAAGATERVLKIPDEQLADFLVSDIDQIMYTYISHVVRRSEYAKRFGNRGEKIQDAIEKGRGEGATDTQVKGFVQYVQTMEGTAGREINTKLRNFMSGVMTYQNLRLLPLSLFSSLVDPNGIALRSGEWSDAPKAFVRGIRELISDKSDYARELAADIGAINTATDEHMVADMYSMKEGGAWQKWLNQKLFKLNGMESWNNSMRVYAAAAGERFIVRHIKSPNKHSERFLRELGLDPANVTVKADNTLERTPEVVDALNRWVDSAVLRPHPAHRPMWMSDPHFMLVSHLKQFTYSFQKTIVSRAFHEAYHGNYKPLGVLASYVPFIIAADILRALATPGGLDDERFEKWSAGDWLYHGVLRSGVTGPGEYAVQGLAGNTASILGPSAEQLVDILGSVGDGDKFSRQLFRAVPPVPVLSLK